MDKITFQDGTKVADAKVTIDGTDYTVTPATYSGATPLSAYNLNQMQANIENAIPNIVTLTGTLRAAGDTSTTKTVYIDAPTGFTNTNSVFIAKSLTSTEGTTGRDGYGSYDYYVDFPYTSRIQVTGLNLSSSTYMAYYYKITLLKTS